MRLTIEFESGDTIAVPVPSFTAQIAGDLALGGTVFGDTPPIPHAFPIATWTAARP